MDELKFETCPHCSGGKVLCTHTMLLKDCTRCYGKGFFILHHICACGKPCKMMSADKILYCGEKLCLEDLRRDKREEENDARWDALGHRGGGTFSRQEYSTETHSWHDVDTSGAGFSMGPFH